MASKKEFKRPEVRILDFKNQVRKEKKYFPIQGIYESIESKFGPNSWRIQDFNIKRGEAIGIAQKGGTQYKVYEFECSLNFIIKDGETILETLPGKIWGAMSSNMLANDDTARTYYKKLRAAAIKDALQCYDPMFRIGDEEDEDVSVPGVSAEDLVSDIQKEMKEEATTPEDAPIVKKLKEKVDTTDIKTLGAKIATFAKEEGIGAGTPEHEELKNFYLSLKK